MSINNLRESPIPPHPEGWGLLGQRVEDSKVTTDRGTNEKSDLVEIDNPMPAWKRAGFKDRDEMITLSAKY